MSPCVWPSTLLLPSPLISMRWPVWLTGCQNQITNSPSAPFFCSPPPPPTHTSLSLLPPLYHFLCLLSSFLFYHCVLTHPLHPERPQCLWKGRLWAVGARRWRCRCWASCTEPGTWHASAQTPSPATFPTACPASLWWLPTACSGWDSWLLHCSSASSPGLKMRWNATWSEAEMHGKGSRQRLSCRNSSKSK